MDELPVSPNAHIDNAFDLACSCTVLLVAAMVAVGFAASAVAQRREAFLAPHRSVALPRAASAMTHWALGPLVRLLVAADVSANTITGSSLIAGIAAGVALALGHFGAASALLVMASIGDALDGLVARSGHGESPAGALFDASVDRYEEFFSLGGLAIFFRQSGPLLALVLSALMGSFMVSYGSAKAEALRVPVPPGAMRRAERATCLCFGTTLVPLSGAITRALGGPALANYAPLLVAIVLIASAANVSAVRRIRIIAARVSPEAPPRLAAKVAARAAVD